jgi:hypothetical protein
MLQQCQYMCVLFTLCHVLWQAYDIWYEMSTLIIIIIIIRIIWSVQFLIRIETTVTPNIPMKLYPTTTRNKPKTFKFSRHLQLPYKYSEHTA